MIVSTGFLKKVRKLYDPKYIEVSYAKTVGKWVLDYYDQFEKAPETTIQDIYDIEKEYLKEEEAEIVEIFLSSLSEEYEREKNVNVDYLFNEAREYFQRRSMEILFEKGSTYMSAGREDEAKKLLVDYKETMKITKGSYNPFDIQRIRQFDPENAENRLFRFPGALGDLCNYFERGWLVAVMAPEKRGKSWLLEEMVFSAMISKLNVFWVSLEMGENQLDTRIYKRLTACASEKEDIIYPVFDCLNNQDGSCKLEKRINNLTLFNNEGKRPEFNNRMKYKPCGVCRGEKVYSPTYWYQQSPFKGLTNKQIEKSARSWIRMYGDRLRMRSFPRFSATLTDIITEADSLEFSEGFVPDVWVVDYLDITAKDKGYGSDPRQVIDENWKRFAGLAAERNCLCVTADQSDAAGRNKRSLTDDNFSESKLKDGHLDMRIALNQTRKEKKRKVMRLAVLMHRHKFYYPAREVMALQELSVGQALLDSEWWHESREN